MGIPHVSVLLPAFDAGQTLASALRSVRRQTWTDFECVIVDDGSADATANIAERVAAADSRFRVIRRTHEGLVASLNAGLEACRAPIVARMDADDVMLRSRLAKQVAALDARESLAAVGAHATLVPRASLKEGAREYEAWIASIDSPVRVLEELFVECPIVHPTLCIRTDVMRGLGWRDRGAPEDYDLVLRLVEGGHEIGVVPESLLLWRQGKIRLQRTSPAYSHEAFARVKAEFLARGFLRAAPQYHLLGYGNSGKLLRAALAREGRTPAAIVDVHRAGNVIDGAPVVGIEALGTLPRRPLLVSVAGVEGRTGVRRELAARGLVERRDFLCAA